MSTKTKMILGLVGAAAAGVVVGLLLAPETGTNTRKRIVSTAGGWTDSLGDVLASAKQGIGNLRSKGARATSDAAESYS